MPTTLLPSLLRTFVPLAVGWMIALPITGPILDFLGTPRGEAEASLTTAVAAVVTGLYYLLARLVEVYIAPRLGGILVGLRPGVAPVSYSGGKHVAGRVDAGSARIVLVLPVVLVLAVVGSLLAADSASAHRPRPVGVIGSVASAPVVAPSVTRTMICDGTLVVGYNTIALSGRQWQPLQDDGSTRLELLEGSGRSGPDGQWKPIVTASGGEHVLRWAGWRWASEHGLHFVLARVVTGGYTSTGYPVEQTCPVAA